MIFSTIVNIYHAINNFLSTPGGDLAKRTLEFVLLFFMTYMAYSELYREKAGKQIQYMATGFFILTLERLLLIISYASVVFGKINPVSILPISYTLSEAGESLGLIFITASFIYPLFWKNRKNFRGIVKKETLLLIAIFILTQGFVLLGRGVAMPPYLVTSYFYFTLFKLGILVLSIFILWKNNEILGKYNRNVVVAFMIYTVTPMITLINFIFYNNNNQYLYVLAHPFPFISILLLLRVTYLKLADKGTLKHDLEIARQRYDHERAVGKMKDDFVSTVSHELRTPLTSMKLYLSLLKQGQFGKLNKQQIEKIDLVRNETSRLTDLINDILDLSRLEKGKSKIHIKETNFRKLVEKSIMPNLSDEKNIIVKNNIPEDIFVNLDENKMKQ
ncbi:MAG: sensor histidine kinase, partial [Candidatus Woesearchaeota archaeon]